MLIPIPSAMCRVPEQSGSGIEMECMALSFIIAGGHVGAIMGGNTEQGSIVF